MMRGVLFGSSRRRAGGTSARDTLSVGSLRSDVLRGLHQNISRSRYAGPRRLTASSFWDSQNAKATSRRRSAAARPNHCMRLMSRPKSLVRIMSAATRKIFRKETCEMVSKDFQMSPPRRL